MLVHLEDMSYANLARFNNQYRGSIACFSDDVQVSLPHCTACQSLWVLFFCAQGAGFLSAFCCFVPLLPFCPQSLKAMTASAGHAWSSSCLLLQGPPTSSICVGCWGFK